MMSYRVGSVKSAILLMTGDSNKDSQYHLTYSLKVSGAGHGSESSALFQLGEDGQAKQK